MIPQVQQIGEQMGARCPRVFTYKGTFGQIGNRLRADWEQIRSRLRADWKQIGSRLRADWEQIRSRLEADWEQTRALSVPL